MKKETVFIVDDEPMHSQMMEDHLKTRYPEFEIFKYKTGEECVENLSRNPGIIILDYHLDAVDKSARNGLQILEFLTKNYPDIPVIMISGQDNIDIAVDCMRAGAYDYVVKNETSFIRTEGAIERIFRHRQVIHAMHKYRRWNTILIIGLVVIVVGAIVLHFAGVIN